MTKVDVLITAIVLNRWSQIKLDCAITRQAHSATQVGSYLFVIAGHDGKRYSNEVSLLNLGKARKDNEITFV